MSKLDTVVVSREVVMECSITEIHIDTEDVKQLSSLHSILIDLKNMDKMCQIALSMPDDREGTLGIDAIGTGVLIKYMRCFHAGTRCSLSTDDLSSLSEDERKAHQYLKLLRDKHIAHSVNSYEKYQIKTYLEIEGDKIKRPIVQLLPASQRVALSKENVWAMKELVNIVIEVVKRKIALEEKAYLKILNALSDEDLLKFKPYRKPLMKVGINEVHASKRKKGK
ncbi:hypothetical protein [Aeromonas hydrophila]|uniref:hypothetical protein n=1 Tax=Aeromonas hydrophila TaxID=644 RepID=UPI001A91D8DE|nr:hypothetical protein [Aeromonas hydrophila]MBO0405733.1 hypothetical protein [Aeromonas hydrophila]